MNELEEALKSPPPKGHNQPPSDREFLADKLNDENTDLLRRREELLAAMARLPDICKTEEDAAKLTSYGNQLQNCLNLLEAARKERKKPFDDLAGVVHAFFETRKGALTDSIGRVKKLLQDYKIDLDNRRRAELQKQKDAEAAAAAVQKAEAQRILEDAMALEKAGMQKAATVKMEEATVIEAAAIQQAASATAPVTLAKTMLRGSVGGSASSRSNWKPEITDFDAIDMKLIAPYLGRAEIEKALRALTKDIVKKLGRDEAPPTFAGFVIKKDESMSFRG